MYEVKLENILFWLMIRFILSELPYWTFVFLHSTNWTVHKVSGLNMSLASGCCHIDWCHLILAFGSTIK